MLLIKKDHAYATRNIDANVHAVSEWGVELTSFPMQIMADAKDYYVNVWPDEDGDDEYIPDEIKMKSYEITIGFAYKGNTPVTDIKNFVSYLAYGGEMKIYDQVSRIGRQNVRYVRYSPKAHQFVDLTTGSTVITFEVVLKVNDPVTQITLSLS